MTSAKIRELQAEVEEGELGRARTMELVADNERLEAELEQLHGPRDCPTRRPPALTRGPRAETCAGPATVTIRVMQTSLTIREAFRGVRRGSPARVGLPRVTATTALSNDVGTLDLRDLGTRTRRSWNAEGRAESAGEQHPH